MRWLPLRWRPPRAVQPISKPSAPGSARWRHSLAGAIAIVALRWAWSWAKRPWPPMSNTSWPNLAFNRARRLRSGAHNTGSWTSHGSKLQPTTLPEENVMPLFLDSHILPEGVTADDVAEIHA